MNDVLNNIDPEGIIVNADGSVTYRNKMLNQIVSGDSDVMTSSSALFASDNFGDCVNSGICSGANLNCNNAGDCTKADNFGRCE